MANGRRRFDGQLEPYQPEPTSDYCAKQGCTEAGLYADVHGRDWFCWLHWMDRGAPAHMGGGRNPERKPTLWQMVEQQLQEWERRPEEPRSAFIDRNLRAQKQLSPGVIQAIERVPGADDDL